MLLNDFFKILSVEPANNVGKYTVKVELNERHHIFDGHFPGNPIVPGVCQVQMVKEILGYIEKKEFMLSKAENIKHPGIIIPFSEKYIDFILQYIWKNDNEVQVDCIITGNGKTFLKFKGSFVITHG
ncbi:MAG: 3-hydroxyacyl-ACP dehydratase [Bacteroidia bacterium]|nr:3-hydroxyacyl-ACP dehydratase [Bacteroidia bacterium]